MDRQPLQLDTGQPDSHPGDVAPPPSQGQNSSPPAVPEPLSSEQIQDIEKEVIEALKTCYDPEIPVNIYELGLIYQIDVSPEAIVHIRMTLTSPACPAAGSLPPEVRDKAQSIPGVKDAKVEVVWDPPWTKERMSEAARLQLGIFD
jgi:FeS assembly SUF system protein